MISSAINAVQNNPYVSAFQRYTAEGAHVAGGLDPSKRISADTMGYRGYNSYYQRAAGEMAMPTKPIPGVKGFFPKAFGIGTSLMGPGFTLYTAYQGYQNNGIAGVKDAVVLEMAAASAASRFAYGSVGTSGPTGNMGFMQRINRIGVKEVGKKVVLGGGAGMGAGMLRFGGAYIGAGIGQELLGTPGAFIGGFIGAAPIRFAATHPLLSAGLLLTGAVAAGVGSVVKGGAAIMRAGAEHRRRQRGIDTSGSMASFMTQNAQTMRARAVQAMHKSHLNARSALGQEASFMHMPSRNYHSRYR